MKQVICILIVWLVSSSAVSAGCAWVLWEMTFTPVSKKASKLTGSMPVSAWNSKEECELALLKRMKEHQDGRIVHPGLVDVEDGPIYDSRCLPDTLEDPAKTLKSHY